MANNEFWARKIILRDSNTMATANIAYGMFALAASISEVAVALKDKK